MHESILKKEPLDMKNYLIKKTFTDLLLENSIHADSVPVNKKRKYEDFIKSPKKLEDGGNTESSKKKKLHHAPKDKKNLKIVDLKGILKSSKFEKDNNNTKADKNKEIPDEREVDATLKETNSKIIPQSNKITNFFKAITTEKKNFLSINKMNTVSENLLDKNENLSTTLNVNDTRENLKLITSIGIGEENKFRINKTVIELGRYKYIGEKLENIKQSEYVVIKENYNKFDLHFMYALINNKKIIYLNYFTESLQQKSYKENISDYFFNPPELKFINSTIDDLPLKSEKFRIFLHPSLYDKETSRKDAYFSILKTLGVEESENNIRLADISIINKITNNEYFPGHVKLLNESFIFDCFYNCKVMDLNNWKYQPELDGSNRK